MWLTLRVGMSKATQHAIRITIKNVRDGVVCQAEDSIKLAKRKRQSGFLGRLTEQLVLDLQVTDLERILADEAFDGSRTILDGESRSILLVGRGRSGVVLCVQETGDAGAAGAGNPEVG